MSNTEHIREITVEELTALYDKYGFFIEYRNGKPYDVGVREIRKGLDR